MASRLNLHTRLIEILGLPNVYYQPPENTVMNYPAIRYTRSEIRATYANGTVYGLEKIYEVIVIDKNPDSEVVDNVASMPKCKFDRHYTSNNLNHDVFILHY